MFLAFLSYLLLEVKIEIKMKKTQYLDKLQIQTTLVRLLNANFLFML